MASVLNRGKAPKVEFNATESTEFRKPEHPTYHDSSISLEAVREFAYAAHDGQKDKSGEDYHHHLEAVRAGVDLLGGTVEEQIAALLHDILEDTTVLRSELRKLGVSEYAVRIVEAVTKPSGAVQSEYLDGVIKAGPGAMRVKTADLMHNLRHDRLAALPEATRDRLHKKYRPALARLLMELELIVDEDAQKKLATKPVGSVTYSSGSYKSGGPTTYTAGSLIKGDWPKSWKAPVLRKDKQGANVMLVLANGQVITVAASTSYDVYTKSTWEKDVKITFPGVTEDDIAAFMQTLKVTTG